MKRLTIILATMIFMFGCITLPKSYIPVGHNSTRSNSDFLCQDLLDDISKKWGHHQDFKTCYYYNQKLVNEIIKRDTCFLKLNRNDVESIFGKPTIVYESKLQYNMSLSCEATDTLIVSPYSLYFKFANNEVVSLQILKASVIH
jgi:hypothetical protein